MLLLDFMIRKLNNKFLVILIYNGVKLYFYFLLFFWIKYFKIVIKRILNFIKILYIIIYFIKLNDGRKNFVGLILCKDFFFYEILMEF